MVILKMLKVLRINLGQIKTANHMQSPKYERLNARHVSRKGKG